MKTKSKPKRKEKNLDRFLKIYVALKRKGISFADIARELNTDNSCVHYFAYGIATSRRFNNWIVENLGIEL